MDDEETSYIDYETFLAPDFRPATYANTLVVSTNNPTDLPLDLSTPLSKVLFDIQEIDSHIDLLMSRSAIPLLEHTRAQNKASQNIITEIDVQLQSLNESYKQLEKEIITKYAEADEVRQVVIRLWETLRIGKSAARCLQLGRQLEVQYAEFMPTSSAVKKEDHRALVRCATTLTLLHEILDKTVVGQEGHGLDKLDAIKTLKEHIVGKIEKLVKESAETIIKDFTLPVTATFAQGEDSKARLVSALNALYLLSPINWKQSEDKFTPEYAMRALELYVRGSLQVSVTVLARALSQLPTMDRAIGEVAAKAQSLVALEIILNSTKPIAHPLLTDAPKLQNFLQPLLAELESGSLVSFFWRMLANNISTRSIEIINRGGIVAKSLKNKKDAVGEAIKECVRRGCLTPGVVATKRASGTSTAGDDQISKKYEREMALMVGAVINSISR